LSIPNQFGRHNNYRTLPGCRKKETPHVLDIIFTDLVPIS